jgi:hypothetical protein
MREPKDCTSFLNSKMLDDDTNNICLIGLHENRQRIFYFLS